MNLKQIILNEFLQEAEITRTFLERFENKLIDFTPHEKSMDMKKLVNHVVEILGWPEFILETEKLDFAAGDYQPTEFGTKEDLQQNFETLVQKSEKALMGTTDEVLLNQRWKMTMGDQIIADWSKYGGIRHALNQLTHHRAQLGVYYRLNNVFVPKSYGPSADDQSF